MKLINDENAAGNDDVSERRAVEHRALEQCDVVHHGVVSGCPVNSCAAVLNEVMSQTGWNAYELAQRTGLDRSAIGRVLRGQRGMLFDVLAEGLERAGFGLHLEAVAPSQTIPEDELHMLLAQLRRPPDFDAIESGATWSTLKMLCVNLIHARNVQHQRISRPSGCTGERCVLDCVSRWFIPFSALGYQPKEQTLDIGSSVPVWLGWMVVPTAERGNYARASSI